jgi:hypothetical protein
MTDSEYERIVDRAVQNRLQRSNRYRNAASAEEQAQVEAEITAAVEADYARRAARVTT